MLFLWRLETRLCFKKNLKFNLKMIVRYEVLRDKDMEVVLLCKKNKRRYSYSGVTHLGHLKNLCS